MTIDINVKSANEEETKIKSKSIEIPVTQIIKNVTYIGILGFISGEINRVRPPKRNIGVIINWMSAFAVTDAIYGAIFPKKKEKDDKVVSEVKADDVEVNNEDKGKQILAKFKEMFPFIWSDNMAVREIYPNTIILDPAVGIRSRVYRFTYTNSGTWELKYE